MERRAEQAKRQERDLEKIISLQRQRSLGHKALNAAELRFAAAEENLDTFMSKESLKQVDLGVHLVEISTIDDSPLILMRRYYTSPHGWTPSHWTIDHERRMTSPMRLYADKAGGQVPGEEFKQPYLSGETEAGQPVTIFLGPNTVIRRIEEFSSDE